MKTKAFIPIFGICLTMIFSCKKESKKDCGCDSPIIKSVVNIEGVLGYEDSKKMYVISSTSPDDIMTSFFYICNPDRDLINRLRNSQSNTIPVVFSGNTKNLCDKGFDIPERSYDLIEISTLKY